MNEDFEVILLLMLLLSIALSVIAIAFYILSITLRDIQHDAEIAMYNHYKDKQANEHNGQQEGYI